MDTYADDLAALTEALDLKDVIHVGHSTGGGEVARYLGRHGSKRVAKAVLIGAVPPLMLKTLANPGGTPVEAFDQIRAAVLADRSQFFKDLSTPLYGANREGADVSQGLRDSFWLQGMLAGNKAVLDCIKALVRNCVLKVIPGAPHGMCSTLKDLINAELLAFFGKSSQAAV